MKDRIVCDLNEMGGYYCDELFELQERAVCLNIALGQSQRYLEISAKVNSIRAMRLACERTWSLHFDDVSSLKSNFTNLLNQGVKELPEIFIKEQNLELDRLGGFLRWVPDGGDEWSPSAGSVKGVKRIQYKNIISWG